MRFSSAQLTPLRLPGFRNLFFATLASSAGTLIAAVALAIDVKARTDSGPWVAAVVESGRHRCRFSGFAASNALANGTTSG